MTPPTYLPLLRLLGSVFSVYLATFVRFHECISDYIFIFTHFRYAPLFSRLSFIVT